MCVASRLVTARPLAPKSQAAWNPRLACDVTQILLGGTWPRTMVQAEAHRPSMITLWPEVRSASYLSRYVPIRPPRSSPIRTTAWLAETPASRRTIASSPVLHFMSRPNPNLLNPNLMVLRDAEASVLSDRVFVQTAELAQPKFKSGVACSLHFSRSVPN